MNPIEERLQLALEMAADASAVILKYYQTGSLVVESKKDDSPVTAADRAAEQLMRDRLQARYPEDGVLGEEFPDRESRNGFRWILDPIDGTKPFIYGVPLFGTLIGIEHQGRMVAGVCRFPALNEVVYAADGQGTWWRCGASPPVRVQVSTEADLNRARLMFTEPSAWRTLGRQDVMSRLVGQVRLSRGWGDCYGHVMVATGRAEIAIDPQMSAWDIAALIPILREAGGYCLDWRGHENVHGGDGISVNAAMRDSLLALLKDIPPLEGAR